MVNIIPYHSHMVGLLHWVYHMNPISPILLDTSAIHCDQWEFQDPKMEVLYHIRPYFGCIFRYIRYIALT